MSASHGRGTQAWRKLRASILAGHPLCAICHRAIASTVDHITPLARGGALLDPSNLRPACGPCNYRAGQQETTRILRARSAARKAAPLRATSLRW